MTTIAEDSEKPGERGPSRLLPILLLSLVSAGILQAGESSGQPASLLPLIGSVHAGDGSPLPGVLVTVLLPESRGTRTAYSDKSGRFQIMLPEGAYEIRAELEGFETMVLEGVRLSREPRAPVELQLLLDDDFDEIVPIDGLGPDALTTSDYPPGSEPAPIPAPNLVVSFQLADSARKDQPTDGLVVLRNLGNEPVLIPIRWRSPGELYRSEYLALNTEVMSPAIVDGADMYDAFFNEWLYCSPQQGDCRSLAPAEAIELPVSLYSHGIESKRSRRSGRFDGMVRASFILPGTDQRTEFIEARFEIDVTVEK